MDELSAEATLDHLGAFAASVNSSLDLRKVVDRIRQECRRLVPAADEVCVLVFDEAAKDFFIPAPCSLSQERDCVTCKRGRFTVREALNRKDVVGCFRREHGCGGCDHIHSLIESEVAVPLMHEDSCVGVLSVLARTGSLLGRADLHTLGSLAEITTSAIANARSYYLLKRDKRLVDRIVESYVAPQVAAQILRDPDALSLGGVRRHVVVLFVDIRNFTRLSFLAEPVVVVEILNEFFESMTSIVYESGAMVDKFIGDSVMALFNAPLDSQNPGSEAVSAAQKMMRSFQSMRRLWTKRCGVTEMLGLGIGIADGSVVLGNVGSRRRLDYTAIGGAVNMASRLCALAADGEILATENVATDLPEHIISSRRAIEDVKGVDAPLRVVTITS